MLARACLGDNTLLAEAHREQPLSDGVVDLVRTYIQAGGKEKNCLSRVCGGGLAVALSEAA